jgi:hypothetical protein
MTVLKTNQLVPSSDIAKKLDEISKQLEKLETKALGRNLKRWEGIFKARQQIASLAVDMGQDALDTFAAARRGEI